MARLIAWFMIARNVLEFFEFNVASLYAGPGTPIFIEPVTDIEELDEMLGT
jgi:hypothetical protein